MNTSSYVYRYMYNSLTKKIIENKIYIFQHLFLYISQAIENKNNFMEILFKEM